LRNKSRISHTSSKLSPCPPNLPESLVLSIHTTSSQILNKKNRPRVCVACLLLGLGTSCRARSQCWLLYFEALFTRLLSFRTAPGAVLVRRISIISCTLVCVPSQGSSRGFGRRDRCRSGLITNAVHSSSFARRSGRLWRRPGGPALPGSPETSGRTRCGSGRRRDRISKIHPSGRPRQSMSPHHQPHLYLGFVTSVFPGLLFVGGQHYRYGESKGASRSAQCNRV
jgi:hypothetical protein